MADTRDAALARLRADARSLFLTGVAAADPAAAVRRALVAGPGWLEVGSGATGRRGDWERIRVIAFGKAAVPMARAAVEAIPDERLAARPLVVTSYENLVVDERLEILGASHPLPDAGGEAAAARVEAMAGDAEAGELVLVLVSGGASALLPLPVPGVSLGEKVATTRLLLACGADIVEINTVRKHLSRIKGGGLARAAAPADVHALILSDVLGDDLSAIASGPTVPDDTTYADALAVFDRRGRRGELPAAVRRHLEAGAAGDLAETPASGDPLFERVRNTLVGSNAVSLEAMVAAARDAGYAVSVFSERLVGEARDAAAGLAAELAGLGSGRRALVAGGETTVTLTGNGRGGRNQELALAFVLEPAAGSCSRPWVLLSAGTDGIDGPTDAAGGIVDGGTVERIRAAGVEPRELLANNDAYRALTLSGDLLVTGATGTNVADLQLLLLDGAG